MPTRCPRAADGRPVRPPMSRTPAATAVTSLHLEATQARKVLPPVPAITPTSPSPTASSTTSIAIGVARWSGAKVPTWSRGGARRERRRELGMVKDHGDAGDEGAALDQVGVERTVTGVVILVELAHGQLASRRSSVSPRLAWAFATMGLLALLHLCRWSHIGNWRGSRREALLTSVGSYPALLQCMIVGYRRRRHVVASVSKEGG